MEIGLASPSLTFLLLNYLYRSAGLLLAFLALFESALRNGWHKWICDVYTNVHVLWCLAAILKVWRNELQLQLRHVSHGCFYLYGLKARDVTCDTVTLSVPYCDILGWLR